MNFYRDDLHRYDDILQLPHHVSNLHPQMTIENRAAQFAPFAALTGYGDAVSETARRTDQKVELDENYKEVLDEKLRGIQSHISKRPQVRITYFKPDAEKEGGAYLTVTVALKKIDSYARKIVLQNNEEIEIQDIINIECDSAEQKNP